MKKLFVSIGFFLLLGYFALCIARHFWRGEVLSLAQVSKRWGSLVFDEVAFKNGSMEQKAKMASSLLKNQKQYIGIDRGVIRERLGNYDGYYFSDMFPTYMIEEGKTDQEDSWQIVFLLDRNEKVSEIIVHKNCCEK